MATFDVHQHLWPDEFTAELAARAEPPCLRGRTLVLAEEGEFEVDLEDHRLERRLEILDQDGTDIAVVSLQPTLGVHTLPQPERDSLVNAWHDGIRQLGVASGDRIRAFASGSCLEGFAGTCVPAQAVVDEGPEFDALLADLAARGQVLFVHPGPARPPAGAPAWWASVVSYASDMQAAYLAWLGAEAELPRPPAVFAVLAGGAPVQLERLASRGGDPRLAQDPTVFLDLASYGQRAIELCLSTVDVRTLLFGSDRPVIDPAPTLQAIHALGDAVASVIREENPTALFGSGGTPSPGRES